MIRKVTAEDKEIYLEMTEVFYNSDAVLHPVPLQNRLAMWDELMRSNRYGECFFYEENGEVKGYMLLAYTFSQEAGGSVCWIEELYVKEKYRNKGIGKQFFEFIKREIEPKCKRIRLEVEDYNIGAKRLYSSLGFEMLPYEQMIKEL
ncbi:MAG: GNAT family N-acetyltransferase [Clostridia bacterium]|nr:GNAT family N-acetyltransferase [Clostridia bacterium]